MVYKDMITEQSGVNSVKGKDYNSSFTLYNLILRKTGLGNLA